MTIQEIHTFINDLLMKELGSYETPIQIDTALDRSQMKVFNRFLPLYDTSEEAQNALAPFKKTLSFSTGVDGKYTIDPSENFMRVNSWGTVFTDVTGSKTREIDFKHDDEWDRAKSSQLRKPTTSRPIAVRNGLGSIELFPAAVYAGTVRILRRPVKPEYQFDQTGRVITYIGAVELEWADNFQNEIILGSLTFLGLNLGDDRLIQIVEALKNAA